MKNLIKNVVRSFKNNKISIIGLVLLLFFGLGTYCTMSNTVANITDAYTSIAQQGNLHDFTASELYEIGNAAYLCTNKGFSYKRATLEIQDEYTATNNVNTISTKLCSSGFVPDRSDDPYMYVVPTQTMKSEIVEGVTYNIYTRTYNLTLDPDKSTGLFKEFAKSEAPEKTFEVRITERVVDGSEPTYIDTIKKLNEEPDVTKWTRSDMSKVVHGTGTFIRESGNALYRDYNLFLKGISERTDLIYNILTGSNTLLSQYIDTEYKNEVQYKFFKSINVTASKDNVFYKVINSNPTDKIDKLVLFRDPKGNYGNNLFDSTDWAPFNSQLKFVDTKGNEVKLGTEFDHFTVPTTFEKLVLMEPVSTNSMSGWSDDEKLVYSQIMQIRFKRMLSGDRSSENSYVEKYLNDVAAITIADPFQYSNQFYSGASTIHTSYEEYITSRDSWNENIIISMNGNIVINWQVPTPMTCTMVNWTSHFSVINPQHLQANNKHVIDASAFNKFEPYRAWYLDQYGQEPDKKLDAKIVQAWFNTLTNKQFNFWYRPQAMTSVNEMEYIIHKKDGTIDKKIVFKGKQAGQWYGVSDESIASCGEYNQIIWGCGLSPDFMYPVVDVTRPTPNVKTECLTYCNESGYKALKLAFFNSPTEEFLAAKFMPSVTQTRQNEIINDLNKFCQDYMIFPKNIKAVYRATDTNNILNSSAFRVSYIPNLVDVIRLITIILSIFLAILALVICLIIIKRYVENNRVNIGIMRANGISKIKIALSLLPFALFPAIIGGISAYLVGLFLQIPMLRLFGNYWTLPTPILSFNWISMVTCIFLPFIMFGVITILSSLWVLRTKSVELMKAGSEFKTNSFSRIAKKPFKHFGILTRFRVSLAFNSLSRLLMLALMSCATMTSLVFAMTSFGKLNQSQAINSSQFDYSFSLQLTTPTTVGGNYNTEDWSKTVKVGEQDRYAGFGYTNPEEFIYNVSWNTYDSEAPEANLTKWYSHNILSVLDLFQEYRTAIGNNGNLFFPTMADASGQKEDLQYLMNKTCSKLTLDYVVGLGTFSSNPWEIAIALMPANSRNMASSGYNYIVNRIGEIIDNEQDPEHTKWVDYKDFFAQDESGKLITPYEMDVSTRSWLSKFSAEYAKFLVQIYSTPEFMANEYRISYGVVPLNWNYQVTTTKKDETYSYVTGTMKDVSSRQRVTYDPNHEIKVEGIKDDSAFIKLTDKNGNNLNKVLTAEAAKAEDYHPIIINAYAAHKYNFNIGSSFTLVSNNTADRFDREINPEYGKTDKSNEIKFRVVGISQGTNGEAFYCTQMDANNVLGLPNGTTWNKTHKYMLWDEGDEKEVVDLSGISAAANKYAIYKVDTASGMLTKNREIDAFNKVDGKVNVPVGYNGIYTADKSGRPLTSGLSLYSYSGLYPGASVFESTAMKTLLDNGNNLAVANFLSGINNEEIAKAYLKGGDDKTKAIKDLIDLLRKYYGDTTMVTCICGAMDVAASDLIYSNLISTFNLAETSIMSVIIPITIIVVGIISNLIINDSRKMAAMLKALGYSDWKNAMSILALFVPTIIFGLALAIPVTIGITTGYQALIFTNANILIDVSRKWWYYLASVGGIGVILVATYAVGLVSLKKDRLVDQIKR